jgi:HEAT repeats
MAGGFFMKIEIELKHCHCLLFLSFIILGVLLEFSFAHMENSNLRLDSNQPNPIMKSDFQVFYAFQSEKQVDAYFFQETEMGKSILAYLMCEDFDCAETLKTVMKFGSEAVPTLIQLLQYGVSPNIAMEIPGIASTVARTRAIRALGDLGDTRALTPLMLVLQDAEPLIRAGGADALGKIDGPAVLPALLPLLKDQDPLVRETTAASLGKIKQLEALPALRSAAEAEQKPHVRHALDAAIEAIGQH